MFDCFDDATDSLGSDEAHDLLRDLEKNTPEAIRKQRAHFRITLKAGIVLQSGNASELMAYKVKGVTGDVSEGGCNALFPIAPRVGDIYRLSFDRETLDLPLSFSRCLRCRLVREDAYEAGFTFFTRVSLPEKLMAEASA